MKLIKDLGTRISGSSKCIWSLFECPKCGILLERRKYQGIKQEQCPSCFREYHKQTQVKHGDRYCRLYRTWINMRVRCLNVNSQKYKTYGGVGISICKEWDVYTNFKDWAILNGYNDTLTIDRIDVLGNYEPSNCQFISNKLNAGKDKIVILEEDFIKIQLLIKQGVGIEDAYTKLGFNKSAYYGAKKRYENK